MRNKTKKKRTTRKLTPEQRKKNKFRKKIRDLFTNAGFIFINTRNKSYKFGNRIVELDFIFVHENIVLICEDTTAADKDRDHIRKKDEAFKEIQNNSTEFLEWLKTLSPEKANPLSAYSKCIFRFLYFSLNEMNLTDEEISLYNKIHFIEPQTLNYFHKITNSIRLSSRYEIYRFLGLTNNDIGIKGSANPKSSIQLPIIHPEDLTGLNNGVRIVSFMVSAKTLLDTCFVLRKDNWEDDAWLYQRLVDATKIKSIRNFVARNGQAFYNNVIVALPDNVRFISEDEKQIPIDQIGNYQACKMEIYEDWNSIGIIDGQHRIYAHYEGGKTDLLESKIAPLREKLHLLATGLIFPEDMDKLKRIQIQSQIFSDINSNAKSVPPDVLLHIESISNPFSDKGIARRVIGKLNKKHIFLNMFELSLTDEPKIKVASIISYALRHLVTISPTENKVSLYSFWQGNKKELSEEKEKPLDEYAEFCASCLGVYFCAVRNRFKTYWNTDKSSKLLSIASINGFIIAYTRQLKENEIQNFDFYDQKLANWDMNFSKESFPYSGSQYGKFSRKIIKEVFGLDPNDV